MVAEPVSVDLTMCAACGDPCGVADGACASCGAPPLPPLRGLELVEPYRYTGKDDELLFVAARYRDAEGGKTFRQWRFDGGQWLANLDGVARVPYHLDRLNKALAHGRRVFVVEGERDVHAIEAAGAVATCNPMGAGKFGEAIAEFFAGAHRVTIVVDRDPPGEQHALQVRDLLGRVAGVASTDIEFVVARSGKDSADHFEAGHSLDEFEPWEPPSEEPARDTCLRVVPFDEFISADEHTEAPLLGSEDKKLLPAGSNLVCYGEGGSGKTTLAIDMAVHLAAGVDWLGFEIGQPVTVLLLENEGPRAEYRLKLRRKHDTWDGPAFVGHVVVYEEPWARVDLRNDDHVTALATAIRKHAVDVLIAGPIRRLGLEGGGTPAETVAFMQLLDEVRDAARRPIAIVLVHHENKGGDISGAFEAEFDTVIHVKPDGRFRTQLYFRKSRWSSRIHRSRATLAWVTERDTFDVVETDIDVDQTAAAQDVRHKVKAEIRAWILEYVDENPGLARGTVETACAESHGRGGRTLAREVIGEELVHGGGLEPGPGKSPTGIYLYRAGTAQAPLDGLSPEDELERPPSARGLPDAESIVALQDDRQ